MVRVLVTGFSCQSSEAMVVRAEKLTKPEVTVWRQVERKSQKGILKKATEDELKDICNWLSGYEEFFQGSESPGEVKNQNENCAKHL